MIAYLYGYGIQNQLHDAFDDKKPAVLKMPLTERDQIAFFRMLDDS